MNNKLNNWLKLKVDFFQNLPMKKLRNIAGGDTYLIIYQKLMLLTVNSEGHFRYQGIENTIEEELALILDEDVDNIKMCLQFLKVFQLLENVNDNVIFMTQVPVLVGKNDDSSTRVAAYRERKKLQCNALQSLHVTESNGPRERERERERVDKEKNIKKENLVFNYEDFSKEQVIAIEQWLDYKKQIKKDYKSQLSLNQLRKQLLDNPELVRDIYYSIGQGYQGIYAPKYSFNQSKPTKIVPSECEHTPDLITEDQLPF